MANLQILLKCLLMLIIIAIVSSDSDVTNLSSTDNFHFYENIPNPFPIHYDIALTILDIENTSNNYFNVSGNVSIIFQIVKAIMSFEINLAPSINILASNLVMKDKPEDTFSWTTQRYTNELSSYQEWVFDKKLEPGMYNMTLKYNNIAHDNEKGFFRIFYKKHKFDTQDNNIQWLVATNSQPNGAHRMFPCFELLESRTTFNISVKVQNKYQILANMETESDFHYPDDLQMNRFVTTPRISVYEVAFLIHNFSYIKDIESTAGGKIYSRNSEMHVDYATTVITNITSLLKRRIIYLEANYKLPGTNYALIPGFPYDSADGWRLVFLREEKAVYNQEIDTFGRKIAVTSFIAQKVMRQWFGDVIKPSNWADLWMNDGLAIFFAMNAVNKTFPEMQMLNLFVVQDIHESLYMDTNSLIKPLYSNVSNLEIDTSFYFFRYLKAPALMRIMYYMTSMLDDDVLKRGVDQYLMHTYYQTPTINEFWGIQEQVDRYHQTYSNLFSNTTLKTVLDTWLVNNYPIVHVTTFMEDNKDVLVKVKQVNSDRYNGHKWWILITWFTDHLLSYSSHFTPSLSKWLRPDDHIKTITTLDSANSWIILNTQRCGYYRVSYDVQNWRRIGRFLKHNTESIHVLNRAQLIDDAFYFVLTSNLDSNVFLELTLFLAQDTDYVAWYPMFKALERMSPIFAFNTTRVVNLKVHLLSLLVPLLSKIGYDAKVNENKLTQCLREEAAKWTCILGNGDEFNECRTIAKQKLEWHLQNRETNRLLPGWKRWTYCEGLVTGDSLIWQNAARASDEERDDAFLEYLMCSNNYYIATQSFETLKNTSIIRNAQPRHDVIHYMLFLAKYANHTIILMDILDDILINKKPGGVAEITGLAIVINNIYTTAGLDRIDQYVNSKMEKLSSMVSSKIAMRKKHLTVVENLSLIITKSVRHQVNDQSN